jgi:serine protease Do
MRHRLIGLLAATLITFGIGIGSAAADDDTGSAQETPGAEADDTGSPLERVNAYVEPSIVYEGVEWTGYIYDTFNKQYLNDGQPFVLNTQCTGFIVNPDGYIATAGHCVDPKGEILDAFVAEAAQWALDTAYYADRTLTLEEIVAFDDYRVEGLETENRGPDREITVAWGATASGLEASQQMTARVIDFQPFDKGDAALLKVEETDLNAIPLATDAEVRVGTEVVSIGYPSSVDLVTDPDLSPSYKEGSISSVKTIQDGLLTVYEISAAVSGGMSGGPTVNLDGEVVGFNSFGISGEEQQFNFVRPAAMIEELMAGAGVSNEVSDTSATYREGLDAYFAEDKDTAIDALSSVVEDQPSNAIAQDYLDRASDLPDDAAADDSSSSTLLVVIIAAAVLIAIGVLVTVLLVRRGRSGPAPAMAGMPSGGHAPVPPAYPAGGSPPTPGPQPVGPPAAAAPPPAAPPPGAPAGPAAPPSATPPPAAPPPAAPPQAPPAGPSPAAPPPAAPAAADPAAGEEPPARRLCPSCGVPAAEGQRFCGSCGQPL